MFSISSVHVIVFVFWLYLPPASSDLSVFIFAGSLLSISIFAFPMYSLIVVS